MTQDAVLSIDICPLCGDSRKATDELGKCPGCGAPPRTKAISSVLESIFPLDAKTSLKLPLLAFAMTVAERKLLATRFPAFKSVSLFGKYAGDAHETGVDVRDLSRFGPESFCGVFGSLLFDYFSEHEQALRECRRVTASGGILLTHISPKRLLADDEPPKEGRRKTSGPGKWMNEVPSEGIASIKVGRLWFLQAMRGAGFAATAIDVIDSSSGAISTWFVGHAV